MKTKKEKIEDFLQQPHIALVGYSRNPKKFGGMIYQTLRQKGYNLYPVNPAGGTTADGDIIYTDATALPPYVKAMIVVTKPDVSTAIVQQAIEKGFTHIWVQQMSDNKAVKEMAESVSGMITGQCILMHAQPSGIHKFHWWLAKLIGKVPA